MTSENSILSKPIHQLLIEYSTPNDTLSNRLLSSITANSDEILSTSISIDRTCSDRCPNLLHNLSINDNLTTNELNHILIEKFHQYVNSFYAMKDYLTKLDQHFSDLSIMFERLRTNKSLRKSIEFIETRLMQMHVKRNQIDNLLNQSSIKSLIEKISPMVSEQKSMIDDNKLLTSIELSINQKTNLIEHLKNEYEHMKYRMNEYSIKMNQRLELLDDLKKKLQLIATIQQHDRIINRTNLSSIIDQHNRQSIELINLSHEYEQLQNENYLLTLKAKETLRRLSVIMQSNNREIEK